MDPATIAAGIAAGVAIGAVLGLVGGGGSILAVPLLVYLVGVESAHAAIGTAAVAVALSAASGLAGHARAKNVKWACAIAFGLAGIAGAALGAEAGKAVDSQSLLGFFGLLMILVGATMLRGRKGEDMPDVKLTRDTARSLLPRLLPMGFLVGLLAGFFGIGGGFLIVPGLVFAVAMPVSVAIGTSLVVITALGLTTATSYALSGYVDWLLVGVLVVGGVIGSIAGRRAGVWLSGRKRLLEQGFAAMVIAIGLGVSWDAFFA